MASARLLADANPTVLFGKDARKRPGMHGHQNRPILCIRHAVLCFLTQVCCCSPIIAGLPHVFSLVTAVQLKQHWHAIPQLATLALKTQLRTAGRPGTACNASFHVCIIGIDISRTSPVTGKSTHKQGRVVGSTVAADGVGLRPLEGRGGCGKMRKG